jgi:hypothetical protein
MLTDVKLYIQVMTVIMKAEQSDTTEISISNS